MKTPRITRFSKKRESIIRIAVGIAILLLLLIAIFPFYWTIAGSLKTQSELFEIPPTIFPRRPTLTNYQDVYHSTFFQCLINSLIVAGISTAISLTLSAPAAYAFSRSKASWLKALFFSVIVIRMFPSTSFMVPMYLMFRFLGAHNTRLALALSHLTWQIPFLLWILESHFRGIPSDLEEAACIDGCSRLSAFVRVILPLASPGLSVGAIFAFITSWNEFPFALVLTSTAAAKTATVSIAETITSYQIFWGRMMASGTIFIAPVLVFSLFAQKYLVEALTTGSVKG